jgi:DnaJ-class molecular chaperone
VSQADESLDAQEPLPLWPEPSDRCSDCAGTGILADPIEPCIYCDGSGISEPRRLTREQLRRLQEQLDEIDRAQRAKEA